MDDEPPPTAAFQHERAARTDGCRSDVERRQRDVAPLLDLKILRLEAQRLSLAPFAIGSEERREDLQDRIASFHPRSCRTK